MQPSPLFPFSNPTSCHPGTPIRPLGAREMKISQTCEEVVASKHTTVTWTHEKHIFLCLKILNSLLVGGFNPLEKISQIGNLPQVGMNIQTIWNHHPGYIIGDPFLMVVSTGRFQIFTCDKVGNHQTSIKKMVAWDSRAYLIIEAVPSTLRVRNVGKNHDVIEKGCPCIFQTPDTFCLQITASSTSKTDQPVCLGASNQLMDKSNPRGKVWNHSQVACALHDNKNKLYRYCHPLIYSFSIISTSIFDILPFFFQFKNRFKNDWMLSWENSPRP